jgi:Flp pilus assembly protein TadG
MRQKRGQRGQELVEFGITIVLFMTIALGLITFGHAFMVANMITHAARDGARLASTWPNRSGPCGLIDSTSVQPIKDAVTNAIASVTSVTGGNFQVYVTQTPTPNAAAPCGAAPQTPTVNVEVTGCVPWVFPLLPTSYGANCSGQKGFSVDRTVSFYDEKIPN